jgi:hypothetical protein
MASNKINRKMKKSSKNSKRNRKQRNHRSQRGGNAPACLQQYTGANAIGSTCGSANIHNTNPQAMGDMNLDNKFNLYGGPVPLGEKILGGGGSCGDEGSKNNGLKSETFKQYIDSMSKSLDLNLKGGGYYFKTDKMIAGNPEVGGYDDCCPPALISGQMVQAGPDQRVCGLGAIRGGSRRKHNTRKNSKSRKSQKSRKSRMQRGGDFTGINRSKPADYSDAFNGEPSVFEYPADMSKRQFEGRQPNYGPLAI